MNEKQKLQQRLHEEKIARKTAEASNEDNLNALYKLNCELELALAEQKKISAQLENRTRQLEVEREKLADERHVRSILQNILESSIEYSIISIDSKGKILVWNEGARIHFGYSASEVVGKNIRILHRREDVRSGKIKKFFSKVDELGSAEHEFEWIRKDGSVFTAAVSMSVQRGDMNETIGYVVIGKDITKAKEMEDRLKKTNQELEQFAYITSHDLKAPLRAIMQLVEWVTEDNQEILNSESKKNLALLHQRSQLMADLIEGILQYSRAGRIDLDVGLVDIKSLIQEIIETNNLHNSFKFIYPEKLPVFNAAVVPITQVFSNLINNAVKHHDCQKGIVEIGAKDLGDFFQFSVKDNGPGIDSKFHDKIFQVFQTLSPKNSYESTGIGLSIVKKIVTSQGGEIFVESQPGKGANFVFTWPKMPRHD